LRDFDRPLKSRGRDAAKQIGKRLAADNFKPDLVLCSPAVRTRETVELVLKKAGVDIEPRYEQRIYEASVRDLREVVSEIPDDKQVVMMIGHNPGFEELLSFLTGELRRMPTCALATIELESGSWKDVRASESRLKSFITPHELPED
jgi:phosphohistidine phosphatase